jgi:hypothetical protein
MVAGLEKGELVIIRQLKFKVGDKVKNVRGRVGKITGIGAMYGDDKRVICILYRLGKKSYWHEWQIEKSKEKASGN